MAKIGIVAVGKLKTKYYESACQEYAKRIKRYVGFDMVELKESPLPKNASEKEVNMAKRQEGEKLVETASAYDVVFCLDPRGNEMTSEAFADMIQNQFSQGRNSIAFLIGGSNGLAENVKSKANGMITFSKMTFPHHLFRVMLLEQVYRAFSILNNEKYHK